ncbi:MULTISPECIES: hypothetical protein [Clostridium]|uniref:Uncharacterized protein n=1 Tax=Clostridium sporogenes TaxID=1509 RepID=A0AAE6LY13_CLOSG|nr:MULTISPECIES: hypothetical protein [Clostridium]APQ78724.1 hypothetical protein RSJ10_3659 [Clostridium botulinum]MBN3356023.1 hypothetical protein [Clostridium botulinum]QDY34635.1 hypothetical protein CGS26_20270 [Clostridium sporogenes]
MENEKITTGDKVMEIIGIIVIFGMIAGVVKYSKYNYRQYMKNKEIQQQQDELESAERNVTDHVNEDAKKKRLLKEYELIEKKLGISRNSIYINDEVSYDGIDEDDYSSKVVVNGKEYMAVFGSVGVTKTYKLPAKYKHREVRFTHYEITEIKKLVLIR